MVDISKGSIICFYTGHVHTHSSSRELLSNNDDRSYLLWIRDDTLVDPGPVTNITAQYINDP
jgi:hypothetical protein